MGIFRILKQVAATAALLLLFSCDRPLSDESYLRTSQKDNIGRYAYEIQMDDPQFIYDVELYLSLHADRRHRQAFEDEVLAEWQAPSGSKYREWIVLDSDADSQDSFFSRTLRYRYREALVPGEYGTWMLRLTFPIDFESRNHVNGVGVRLIRNGSR